MPAAKFSPVRPRTTTRPPVMYSHPWSPTPSHDGVRAGIAHAEALARKAGHIRLAARRAVERNVADDDVFARIKSTALGREDDQVCRRRALFRNNHCCRRKDAMVSPLGINAPKLWPPPPLQSMTIRVVGKRIAEALRNFGPEDRAEGTVGRGDRKRDMVASSPFLNLSSSEGSTRSSSVFSN